MKKILVIEDNLEVRENISEILELAGYHVDQAENGKRGVEKAKESIPDLILCDVMMPEMDGYGVLYLLNKLPETNRIPFVFLTAKSDKSDFRKGMSMGADDYLTKPFEDTELLNAIELRLKKSEIFQQPYTSTIQSVDQFIDQARGMEELNSLSKDRKVRLFKKKETIFREGDSSTYLYLVVSGKVKTSKNNDDGKEYITALYKEGDFIGYTAILEHSDYHETASVLEDAELCLIPKQDFLDLIYKNREVAAAFIRILSNNVHEKEKQLIDLAYNTVRKRVADALLYLQRTYQEKAQDTFSIVISRDDIASIVGTATESVIRTLSEFKSDKLIEIKGSQIMIIDARKLESMRY